MCMAPCPPAPQGKGVVCTLHEGDDFGKLSLLTEGERSASIRTREPNCYFLRIERNDFRRILLSVESSTMKVTDRGREVMHLQRESVGRSVSVVGSGCVCVLWEMRSGWGVCSQRHRHIHHAAVQSISALYSYTVVRGTPDRMLDHLIGSDVNASQETSFAHDFFLTHPAFMSMADLCTGLMAKYRQKKADEEEEEEVGPQSLWSLQPVVNIIIPSRHY